MNAARQVLQQELIEETYSRKSIDSKIRYEIDSNPFMDIKRAEGCKLLYTYFAGEYYESKMKRLAQLDNIFIEDMVLDIFVGIAYFQQPELLSSVAAQIAARLKLSDKVAAITTVAEILAILCQTDAFDINKEDKYDSLRVISKIPLSTELLHYVENSIYLPPMICMPRTLTSNYTSGYLTHNDCLILGNGNAHTGDITLDVLNTMNRVALKLDTDFLDQTQELPTFELDTPEKISQWTKFREQSVHNYRLMINQGNKFYLCNKVDKRGRIYASGYTISTQGTAYKKASIEFHREELVGGCP